MAEPLIRTLRFKSGMLNRMIWLESDETPRAAWPVLCEIFGLLGWREASEEGDGFSIEFNPRAMKMEKYGLTEDETAAAFEWLEHKGVLVDVTPQEAK